MAFSMFLIVTAGSLIDRTHAPCTHAVLNCAVHTHTHNRLATLCPGLSGYCPGQYHSMHPQLSCLLSILLFFSPTYSPRSPSFFSVASSCLFYHHHLLFLPSSTIFVSLNISISFPSFLSHLILIPGVATNPLTASLAAATLSVLYRPVVLLVNNHVNGPLSETTQVSRYIWLSSV